MKISTNYGGADDCADKCKKFRICRYYLAVKELKLPDSGYVRFKCWHFERSPKL